jgi:Mor family transcriptional regulator
MTRKSEEVVKKIIEEYKSGRLKSIEICRKYNITYPGLYHLLHRNGIKLRKTTRIAEEKLITASVIHDYLLGYTLRALERKYNLSRVALSNILKRSGIAKRYKGVKGNIRCHHFTGRFCSPHPPFTGRSLYR